MLMSSGGRTDGRGDRRWLGLELSPEMNSQFVPFEFGGLIRKVRKKEGSAAAETTSRRARCHLLPPAHSNLLDQVLRFLIKTFLTLSLSFCSLQLRFVGDDSYALCLL